VRLASDRQSTAEALVHEIRLATKEYRALLRLLRQPAAARFRARWRERLRRAAQSLAPDRDAIVIRQTLRALALRADARRERLALQTILHHLHDRRAQATASSASLRGALDTVERCVRELQQAPARWFDADALLEALAGEHNRVRKLTRQSRRKPDARQWHLWRRRVKALHYQVDWLRDDWPGRIGRIARRTWKLQSLLGCHHDLHVAAETVRRLRGLAGARRNGVVRLIRRRAEKLERKVMRESRALLKLCADDFERKLRRRLMGD
jgi:CHAD domain-containing protein